MKFNELICKEQILKVIEEKGYEAPTEIQTRIMPLINDKKDVLGQSQTGTGKTLAFAASILDKIEENKKTQALILSPTRELAIQIAREIESLGKYTNINVTCVYGSSSIENQIKDLKRGVEIVVGTPGRVKDLIGRRRLEVNNLSFFILDEADEMLSMGFQEEIENIFEKTNQDKQVMLFSATMPHDILMLAKKYMASDYEYVSVITNMLSAESIKQEYYIINDRIRFEALLRTMDYYNPKRAIIFCRTKRNADELLDKMINKNLSVDIIHGDITQGQRIATLDKFKAGNFKYLIATDVAARGIHVEDVDIVFNYNLPDTNEAYVHRIGRTGRTNKEGLAVTFIKKSEERIISSLEHHINAPIERKEIPTKEEILSVRSNDIEEELDEIKDLKIDSNFNNYIDSLSSLEKSNIIKHLLQDRSDNKFGSNFDIDVNEQPKKEKKRDTDDSVRVFMTIGKLDKIEKRDLLLYIEKKAGVREGTCDRVEIMPKFTFMNIKKDCYDKVFNMCNNTKYKGRLLKIEKARK